MAVVSPTEAVRGLGNDLPLPRNRYTIQCTDENFDLSRSSQNPMITRKWQIVAPETVQIGGKTVNVGGTEVTQYLVTHVSVPEGATEDQKKEAAVKTAAKMGRVYEDYDKLGIPYDPSGMDSENVKIGAVGIVADAILDSEKNVMRQAPTDEQRAKKEQGSPILDAEGKQIESYRPRLVQILGLSTLAANTPY